MTSYSLRDLVQARLSDERFSRAHPDLATFHARRYRAMAAAFGVPVDSDVRERDHSGLSSLERAAVSTLRDLRSPFAGYLEAPEQIHELHRQFAGQIGEGIDTTRDAVKDLLLEITIRRHRLSPDASVSDADLAAHGFDPATPWPDEWDYL